MFGLNGILTILDHSVTCRLCSKTEQMNEIDLVTIVEHGWSTLDKTDVVCKMHHMISTD